MVELGIKGETLKVALDIDGNKDRYSFKWHLSQVMCCMPKITTRAGVRFMGNELKICALGFPSVANERLADCVREWSTASAPFLVVPKRPSASARHGEYFRVQKRA